MRKAQISDESHSVEFMDNVGTQKTGFIASLEREHVNIFGKKVPQNYIWGGLAIVVCLLLVKSQKIPMGIFLGGMIFFGRQILITVLKMVG